MNAGIGPQPLKALLVEDNLEYADILAHQLRQAGYDMQWSRIETEAAFLLSLQKPPDIIFSDFSMPQFGCLRAGPRIPRPAECFSSRSSGVRRSSWRRGR